MQISRYTSSTLISDLSFFAYAYVRFCCSHPIPASLKAA
jgi:hypothetical protein